ncbi:hypothetical protein [Photobacterium leiognathi]|uniref:hypothetical protein n=1 Tax=Photobacterium leiognathi TaxID=553611 RepID=UPI000D16C77F|nr:hypothetical protein [Photobacterium leiognathi]PSW57448.1 hypothetical protein C0W50_07665 [Photobacterium leiognathi subsp. mandapamensis]
MNKEQRLDELKFYFDMANKTYHEYIANDSKYLYALIIKKYNLEIRKLVISLTAYLPKEFYEGCIELCHHLDVWLTLFDDLEKKCVFLLDERFVFDNEVNFPSGFVNKLNFFEF